MLDVHYKITRPDFTTHGGCLWGEGVTHHASGRGNLCSSGWLHAYSDPLLAVLLNPIHANYTPFILWKAKGSGLLKNDRGLKLGRSVLTTVRVIPTPIVTTEDRIRFAILCAGSVFIDPAWNSWANDWLSGKDRANAATYAANAASTIDLPKLARQAVEAHYVCP